MAVCASGVGGRVGEGWGCSKFRKAKGRKATIRVEDIIERDEGKRVETRSAGEIKSLKKCTYTMYSTNVRV